MLVVRVFLNRRKAVARVQGKVVPVTMVARVKEVVSMVILCGCEGVLHYF